MLRTYTLFCILLLPWLSFTSVLARGDKPIRNLCAQFVYKILSPIKQAKTVDMCWPSRTAVLPPRILVAEKRTAVMDMSPGYFSSVVILILYSPWSTKRAPRLW
ncbi:hypothetical protein DFS33DRAFT_1064798 [Desarmillaria ectypa]|nr:hypothetical protein DFS33DRAFT_1064798 [Desarmillaria ectypa]